MIDYDMIKDIEENENIINDEFLIDNGYEFGDFDEDEDEDRSFYDEC